MAAAAAAAAEGDAAGALEHVHEPGSGRASDGVALVCPTACGTARACAGWSVPCVALPFDALPFLALALERGSTTSVARRFEGASAAEDELPRPAFSAHEGMGAGATTGLAKGVEGDSSSAGHGAVTRRDENPGRGMAPAKVA